MTSLNGQKMNQFAVIGNPVAHSLSPQLHSLFAKQAGINLHYSTILAEAAQLSMRIGAFFASGGNGLNVTVPFKQDAFQLCEQTSALAKQAQAVNTLWLDNDKLCGDTTDGPGLVKDLTSRCGLKLARTKILIVGAGGTVASILPSLLAEAPAVVQVANRTLAKAQRLQLAYPNILISDLNLPETSLPFDLIINATSLSLQGKRLPLPDTILQSAGCYYDCVYGKSVAPVLHELNRLGVANTFDGSGMLVEQAALSFLIWHHIKPDTNAALQQII